MGLCAVSARKGKGHHQLWATRCCLRCRAANSSPPLPARCRRTGRRCRSLEGGSHHGPAFVPPILGRRRHSGRRHDWIRHLASVHHIRQMALLAGAGFEIWSDRYCGDVFLRVSVKEQMKLISGMIATIRVLILALPALAMSATTNNEKNEYLLFVGTYTARDSKGIYGYRFSAASKKLIPLGLVAETPNPSFLAIDPSGRFLYAVNELEKYKGEASGSVSAFAIDKKSGKLSLLNQVSSRGTDP